MQLSMQPGLDLCIADGTLIMWFSSVPQAGAVYTPPSPHALPVLLCLLHCFLLTDLL